MDRARKVRTEDTLKNLGSTPDEQRENLRGDLYQKVLELSPKYADGFLDLFLKLEPSQILELIQSEDKLSKTITETMSNEGILGECSFVSAYDSRDS